MSADAARTLDEEAETQVQAASIVLKLRGLGISDRAVLKAIETFPAGVELVTLYYGEDATLQEAEAVSRKIGERLRAEVEVVHGGQPHYRYLISAE